MQIDTKVEYSFGLYIDIFQLIDINDKKSNVLDKEEMSAAIEIKLDKLL